MTHSSAIVGTSLSRYDGFVSSLGEAMRRRAFIKLISGVAVAWPLAARAQQTAKLPTIGFLGAGRASGYGKLTDAFATRMRELGWIEGSTVAINYRWAEGNTERLADIAGEFVRLKVDVMVTNGNVAIAAAKRATSQIPIVFAVRAIQSAAGWWQAWRALEAT